MLATAKAIQFALYTYRYPSTTPSDFCNVLGVKAGLVGPSGNATKYKRLLINRFLLETIVLSVVDPEDLEDGIDLRRLGELLRDSYRIIIGSTPFYQEFCKCMNHGMRATAFSCRLVNGTPLIDKEIPIRH